MIKGNESHVENFNPIFLHCFLITSKCFILMLTPLQLDNWLQIYEELVNAKNNIKQRNLNTVFANTSKSIFPTSDSFLLIMSQITLAATIVTYGLTFLFLIKFSEVVSWS